MLDFAVKQSDGELPSALYDCINNGSDVDDMPVAAAARLPESSVS